MALWSEILDYAQGVMLLEGIENSRTAMPMTDKTGMTQFRRSQKEQLESIWEIMFPRSLAYKEEMRDKRAAFVANRNVYKQIADDINRERGIT